MPRFDFYLHDLSFKYQQGITIEQLHQRIEYLASDCQTIREAKEVIYRCNSIYEVPIFEANTIMDVIWPSTNIFNRDQRYYLQLIIDHSRESPLTSDEIIEFLQHHDRELVNGLLCLHPIDCGIPMEHLVYDENDWRKFHRYFLGVYYLDPDYFLIECLKCFPGLHIHERNYKALGTFREGFGTFARNIVNALGALNDILLSCLNLGDIPKSLKTFSSLSGYETTNEGELSRKKALNFSFSDVNGKEEIICCEPHIKISQSDLLGDNTFYFYRIYFHFGKPNIANGKILVGHIGEHL